MFDTWCTVPTPPASERDLTPEEAALIGAVRGYSGIKDPLVVARSLALNRRVYEAVCAYAAVPDRHSRKKRAAYSRYQEARDRSDAFDARYLGGH
jgi:hypothetical protein